MEPSRRSRSPFSPTTAACPRCGRASASPFAAVGVCLRCAGERVLAGDPPPAPPPAISVELTLSERAGLPPRIGRYEIIEELGRGGMGCVYAARQLDLGRIVALKALGAGARAAELELRFLREGQTMARLRHPHIVTVHDSGCADGHAFLAMDYIEGGDLARRLRERPLLPREAATLVRKVADALAYTHREGVLHRDLKPSNILLDGDEPRVADFGLAAELAPGGDLTAATKLIGTPHYLAPEAMQSGSAALTVASDLYALGVVLFETLTGRTPFAGATPAELPALIANAEPPSPRLLAPAVPRDLETICLKCLEREPARRYATADALAGDLRRFLAGEPIAARPPGVWGRFGKFARRHRTGFAAAVIVLVALSAATAISVTQAARARQASREAEREAAAANEVLTFLKDDLLAQASPERQPDRDLKLRTILDRASAGIDRRFLDRPQVEAPIREMLGVTYASLGEYKLAQSHLTRALALSLQLHGADDGRCVDIEIRLIDVLTKLALYPEAEQRARPFLARLQRLLGPENQRTLRATTILAVIYVQTGRAADGEPLIRRTLATQERVFGPDHPDTIASMSDLGLALDRLGRIKEAEPFYTQGLERARRTLGVEHALTSTIMNNLVSVFMAEGKLTEAEVLLLEAVSARQRVFGPEHPFTLSSMNALAVVYRMQRRLNEAESLLRKIAEARARVLSPEHPNTLTTLSALAGTYREQGRLDEAITLYSETLEKRMRVLTAEHPDTWRTVHALAQTHAAKGNAAQASELFARAFEGRRRVLGPTHPDTVESMWNFGVALQRERRFAEAEPVLRASYEIAPASARAAAADRLARFYAEWGRESEAAEWRQKIAVK